MSAVLVDLKPYVPLFLPIVWVLVSSLTALALYRTSSALVEQVSDNAGTRRTVRLVGSAAIAVVIFVLLWRATPAMIVDPSEVRVSGAEQRRLESRALEVEQAWDRLEGCLRMTSTAECRKDLDDLKSVTRQLNASVKAVVRPAEETQ